MKKIRFVDTAVHFTFLFFAYFALRATGIKKVRKKRERVTRREGKFDLRRRSSFERSLRQRGNDYFLPVDERDAKLQKIAKYKKLCHEIGKLFTKM